MSIRKRTWTSGGKIKEAWCLNYVDQHGKRRQQTFNTKKLAEQHKAAFTMEILQGTHLPPSMAVTVAEAARRWIRRAEREELEIATIRAYRNLAELHVLPLLGSTKLSKLTVPVVTDFRNRLLEGRCPAAERTVDGKVMTVIPAGQRRSRGMTRSAVGALSMILSNALEEGLVSQNVLAGRRLGGRSESRDEVKLEKGRSFPGPVEIKAMIDAAPDRWRPVIVTLAFCGLRASELRGLRWEDVDLDARTLHVRQRADADGHMGSPKSRAGRREIPLAPIVLNTLREWKLRCPRGELGLVFPNSRGRVQSHATLAARCLGPIQVKVGLIEGYRTDRRGRQVPVPKYSLHCLRHFFASWLIDRQFNVKRIQAMLGHANISMTLDTYGHLFPTDESDHERLAAGELHVMGAAG
jgi:integrase